MTASILFCSDPLSPSRVDSYFAGQAEAMVAAGATVALVDHDALLRGEAARAVRRVPEGIGPCWYRGWMVPAARYAELEAALAERGGLLLTDAASYRRAHELPGWFGMFGEVTPPSVWMAFAPNESLSPSALADLARPLGGGPGVVKDFVKSRKHEWHEACYVSDLDDAVNLHAVVSRFIERQGDELAGGLVLRTFEEFEPGEARVWWLDGEVVLVGPHPDTPDLLPRPDLAGIAPLVKSLACRFVTTDLARHVDGRWRVVEVGDGQVSDLPRTVPPSALADVLPRAS
ncbi:MAG TPA: ATP-grasp domain-containing protein [Candidatus Limnocylindrales bacterium]